MIEEPLVVRSELGGSLHVAGVNLILMPAFKHSIVVHAFGNDASSGIIGLLHGVVPNNLVIDTLPDGSASFLIHERCQTLIVKDICNNSRKIKGVGPILRRRLDDIFLRLKIHRVFTVLTTFDRAMKKKYFDRASHRYRLNSPYKQK